MALEKDLCKGFLQSIAEKNILPCKGCYACQKVSDEYGYIQQDDIASFQTEEAVKGARAFARKLLLK